jgi:hypothetical protein
MVEHPSSERLSSDTQVVHDEFLESQPHATDVAEEPIRAGLEGGDGERQAAKWRPRTR